MPLQKSLYNAFLIISFLSKSASKTNVIRQTAKIALRFLISWEHTYAEKRLRRCITKLIRTEKSIDTWGIAWCVKNFPKVLFFYFKGLTSAFKKHILLLFLILAVYHCYFMKYLEKQSVT